MTRNYSLHIFSLCVLFVLGNAVIAMPFTLSNIFAFLIFCIISLMLILAISFLLKRQTKSKLLFYCLILFLSVTAVYGSTCAFIDYLNFLKNIQLPQTKTFFLATVLIFLVVFFVTKKSDTIYKYSLLIAIVTVAIILLCGVFGIKNLDYSLLNTNLNLSFGKFEGFLRFFLPVAILPLFFAKISYSTKNVICGSATGFVLLTFCLFQTVLTLNEASTISFPYLRAIGVISSGSLFTRLDGLVYFVFFATSITRITVCIKALEKIKNLISNQKQGI